MLWRAHVVEGKDYPSHRGTKQYHGIGKTFVMMLRMCKPIFGSGKAVVFESGIFVSKGVVEL